MITVTERAAKKLRQLIQRSGFSPEKAGISCTVKSGGCSGFAYVPLVVLPDPKPHDKIFESNGIRIFIDPKSLFIIDGTEIDHSDNLLENYIFNNPNAKANCGCGVSFELKK